ncbi:MAG TPA: hypothetical protein VGH28_24100 [Polyangiaceae bacterium]|jgi:hypothetical protein
MSWQLAFVATSVALGETVDGAVAALGDDKLRTAALETLLRTGTREARARALAQQLAPVVAELDAMEATWHA